MDRETLSNYLLMLLAMFFWGVSWVSAKIVVAIAPPMTIGFFRFLTASLLFLAMFIVLRRPSRAVLTRRALELLALTGLTGIFGYGVLFLTGMRFTTAA